jgi:hypothetical protein
VALQRGVLHIIPEKSLGGGSIETDTSDDVSTAIIDWEARDNFTKMSCRGYGRTGQILRDSSFR